MRRSAIGWLGLVLTAGCAGASASAARTSYVVAHGALPEPEEIRVEEFLADYREALPDPAPFAAGVTFEGARAAWDGNDDDPLFVVQAAVRARNADVRPPVALMLVVDRSGSMGEQDKMTYVQAALHRMIDRLEPTDAVGITAFDDGASLVLPLTPIAERVRVHAAISSLSPGGATNLSEGLRVGYEAIGHADAHALRRVVLLTDAVANVGITDLTTIAQWAEQGDHAGVRLSCIGVGLDHRDDVLVEMARRGRGNHYFLESAERIEQVFDRELATLVEAVADRVYLTFTPRPGLQVVQVDGGAAEHLGAHLRIDLGRLGAAEHRIVLFTLRGVDALDRTPDVGRFTLDFVDMRAGEPQRRAFAEPVFAVSDASEGSVARNAAVAWMARDLRVIAELARAGQYDRADARLARVRGVVTAVSGARPADRELIDDLTMLRNFAEVLSRYTGRAVTEVRARVRVVYEGS